VAFSLFGLQFAHGPHSSLVNNDLSQSLIGAEIEEDIGFGTKAVGKMESYFDPLYGETPDMCKGLIIAATNHNQTVAGDGRVCGQAFGGVSCALRHISEQERRARKVPACLGHRERQYRRLREHQRESLRRFGM
jgi:hypothetical protein